MTATPRDVDLAWLAGLWDGEGSVGVAKSHSTGRLILIPQVQIHMTHQPTIERAVELLKGMGIHAISYMAQEKQSHHRDSYHVAFRRTLLVKLAAEMLMPYAVTKLPQWKLAHEICVLRIERQGITSTGNLRRGGGPGWAKPYTERELALVQQLCEMNTRPTPAKTIAHPEGLPA